jgi:hypothetical protein
MHDTTLEERLRAALRVEADDLRLSVTPDELERRFELRRRARRDQRFGLLAAAVGIIAVGAVFALAVGPFRGPTVAATPQPSVLPSPMQPSAPPSSVPPARSSDPLGALGQAVLVRPTGEDLRRPDSFEVSLYDPVEDSTEILAAIPGSVLPEDGWLDGGEGAPVVSTSGYLAIPFTRGPNEDDRWEAIAIVDIRAPSEAAWLIDRARTPRWGPAEALAIERTDPDGTWIASIMSRSVTPSTSEQGVTVGLWSSDPDARFLATNQDGWGYVGSAGTFTATTDLPAVHQRSGRERPAGVDLHTLGMGCDSGPSGGGCILGEWGPPDEPPIRSWHTEGEGPLLADHAWAVDGRGVLLLLTSTMVGDRIPVELVYADTPEHRTTVGAVEVPEWVLPAILGISAEPTPGRPTITAIGDAQGRVFAFLYEEGIVRTQAGTAWFAGWADDPASFDPD